MPETAPDITFIPPEEEITTRFLSPDPVDMMDANSQWQYMGQQRFDNMYGVGAFSAMTSLHNFKNALKNSGSYHFTGEGAQNLFGMMQQGSVDGFNLYDVEAFGRHTIVSSQGDIGLIEFGQSGGIGFSNPTASVFMGATVVESAAITSTKRKDFLKGILTVGFTGTASVGLIGGSFEIGLAYDGKDYSPYLTLEHAVGVDLSMGGIINYHSPNEGNLTYSQAEGWGESYNGAVWIFDGTFGGNSLNHGIDPNNYSDYHTQFNTYGFGISPFSFPIGFTRNKGYTWYY